MNPNLPSWLASGTGGTPLVLLHGMGSTASVWCPQLEHFGRERLTVAWTMPGYGASPSLAELSWPALADALEGMREALHLERFHLLGHSIGGMVAQAYRQRYPERVASLMLSSSSAGFGQPAGAWQTEFVRLRAEPLAAAAHFGDAAPAILERLLGPQITPPMRALAELSAHSVNKSAYLAYLALLTTFDGSAGLAAIDVPTLLLTGELDTQAPRKAQERLAARIARSRLQVLPGLGHMAPLEAPAVFNRTVGEFIAAIEHP